ncbi:MAG TPA: 5-formyltetrahydrofolate cyclo-ligase [Candidatus Saccharimonadales bacterium]|nr:5-formyltetrahydrofolate cyclo-ligase [Candidatus Saccharimonadales bacterium]
MDKDELRALYRQIRLRMSRSEVSSKSRIIGRKLLNEIDWNSYALICAFEPIADLNEVDISAVISRLKAQRREVVVLPSNKEARVPVGQFNLIIVPCLAYDSANYRLGWGGGFYDRLLAKQPMAQKVGVCFSTGFADGGLPHEKHDIPLDKILTEI